MFPDYPLRKEAYLDQKIRILPSRPMEIFLKPGFWSKIEIFLCAFFETK